MELWEHGQERWWWWWCAGGWFRSATPDRRRPHPPGFRPLPLRPPSTPTTTLIDFSITSRQFTIRAVSFRRRDGHSFHPSESATKENAIWQGRQGGVKWGNIVLLTASRRERKDSGCNCQDMRIENNNSFKMFLELKFITLKPKG